MQAPFSRALHALAVNHSGGGAGLTPVLLATFYGECMMDVIQRSIVTPSIEVIMDRAFGRQVLRDVPPLAARAEDIHKTVHDLADVHRTLVAARFGGRKQRLDLRPFFVRQIMRVASPATVVSKAGLICPHRAPRKSVPSIDSHATRAGQSRPTNRL